MLHPLSSSDNLLLPSTSHEQAKLNMAHLSEETTPNGRTNETNNINTNHVPLSERRGLLSFLTLIPEYKDARNYSSSVKLVLVAVIALAANSGPMGTSIMFSAIENVASSLNTTVALVNISVGMYLLALGIFPMWWSNFSERHGRRTVYVLSFTWFLIFSIACAFSNSVSSLIIMRLLSGAGASAVQACGAATVSDLYIQEERGTALGLFYLGPLLGPFLSPIIGGAVSEAWNWRAGMWFMVILCGFNLLMIVFLLPETLRKEDSMEKIKQKLKETTNDDLSFARLEPNSRNLPKELQVNSLNSDNTISCDGRFCNFREINANREEVHSQQFSKKIKWNTHVYDYLVRPAHAVVLLGYPPVALTVLYSAISFMGIYFMNVSLTYEYYKAPYNFNALMVGLTYAPNAVAYVAASVLGGRWNDILIRRYARQHNGKMNPESRISWNVVTSVILYPPACLIFGWCLQYGEHWVIPLIGSAIFGFASMLVIGVTVTYLVDLLPGKGGTAVAVNNLIRQILAAVATFITEPLLLVIGVGILFTIYAGVISLAALTMWYLKRNSEHFRKSYNLSQFYAKL